MLYFLLSLVSLFMLVVPPIKVDAIVGISMCCFILFMRRNNVSVSLLGGKIKYFVLFIVLNLLLIFIIRWSQSSMVVELSSRLGTSKYIFLLATGMILVTLSLKALLQFVNSLAIYDINDRNITEKGRDNKSCIPVICLISFITITLFSTSSFLYPFNLWVDSNCYLTIGRGMLEGNIPYRDLVDHKGPLIYIIHAFAAMFSRTSFIGVYFVEVCLCVAFLYFSYKLTCLYGKLRSKWLLVLLASVVYSSYSFSMGDSAEEICLPFMVCSWYIALKDLRNKGINIVLFISAGVCFGVIFWIKYTMLGFYIGWFFCFLIVNRRNLNRFFCSLFYAFLGFCIVSAPILLYFYVNDSLQYLWEVYFYDNIFQYNPQSSVYGMLYGIYDNATLGWVNNIGIFIFVFGGLYYLYHHDRKSFTLSLVSFIFLTFFCYVGSTPFWYYTFILSTFTPLGMLYVIDFLRGYKLTDRYLTFGVGVIAIGIALTSSNLPKMFVSEEQLPHYKFSKIINSDKEQPTLLNFGGLDGGFYTFCDIIPNCKYFCVTNLNHAKTISAQKQHISDKNVKYIIALNYNYDFPGYVTIDSVKNFNNNSYYLYCRK